MGLAGPGSRVFYFTTSLALSRNFLKFSISLRPTRVNLSTASSTTIPHPAEGAALLCGRLPPSFSVSPFRLRNLGLFGALLQPPAPKRKIFETARKGGSAELLNRQLSNYIWFPTSNELVSLTSVRRKKPLSTSVSCTQLYFLWDSLIGTYFGTGGLSGFFLLTLVKLTSSFEVGNHM